MCGKHAGYLSRQAEGQKFSETIIKKTVQTASTIYIVYRLTSWRRWGKDNIICRRAGRRTGRGRELISSSRAGYLCIIDTNHNCIDTGIGIGSECTYVLFILLFTVI